MFLEGNRLITCLKQVVTYDIENRYLSIIIGKNEVEMEMRYSRDGVEVVYIKFQFGKCLPYFLQRNLIGSWYFCGVMIPDNAIM